MQTQTFATRTRTQAPSQKMRGVAAPCVGSPAADRWSELAPRGQDRVHPSLGWSDTRFGGWEYGSRSGGGPA